MLFWRQKIYSWDCHYSSTLTFTPARSRSVTVRHWAASTALSLFTRQCQAVMVFKADSWLLVVNASLGAFRSISTSRAKVRSSSTQIVHAKNIFANKYNGNLFPNLNLINLAEPTRQHSERAEIANLLQRALKMWASAPHIVPKPGPVMWRFTADLRPVNKFTVLYQFWSPNVEPEFDKKANARLFVNVDFTHSYSQILLAALAPNCQSIINLTGSLRLRVCRMARKMWWFTSRLFFPWSSHLVCVTASWSGSMIVCSKCILWMLSVWMFASCSHFESNLIESWMLASATYISRRQSVAVVLFRLQASASINYKRRALQYGMQSKWRAIANHFVYNAISPVCQSQISIHCSRPSRLLERVRIKAEKWTKRAVACVDLASFCW